MSLRRPTEKSRSFVLAALRALHLDFFCLGDTVPQSRTPSAGRRVHPAPMESMAGP
ncbi:MAG: hypothetical protein JO075_05860 [Acidimicrobiia bacterium]|nr:hypothetical protein [Acidimicrobiia bacterium]